MKRITKITVLTIALIFGGMFVHSMLGQSDSTSDNKVLIYDGMIHPGSYFNLRLLSVPRKKLPEQFKSPGKQILAKSSRIKTTGLAIMKSIESIKTSVNCKQFSKDKIVLSAADGAFTKPNTKQTAYLYKLYMCDEDKKPQEEYADPIGGIVIVETGKIVANYVYAGFKFSQIKALPDINQNGLSEIILAEDHSNIDIAELSDNTINFYGTVKEVHSRNGGIDAIPYTYNSKKIYAVPGKNPEFFQEIYYNGQSYGQDSNGWKLSKPLEKFSLKSSGDWSSFFRLVK